MAKLTLQQVFDRALQGIHDQDYQQSLKGGTQGACAYRGENGRKCAIGHCIDDDELAERMDYFDKGTGIETLMEARLSFPELHVIFDVKHVLELRRLQRIHDGSHNKDQFLTRMWQFAQENNLTFNLPE